MHSDNFDLDSILADFYDDDHSAPRPSFVPEAPISEENLYEETSERGEYEEEPYEDSEDCDDAEIETEDSFEANPHSGQLLSNVQAIRDSLPPVKKPRLKKKTRRALTTILLCASVLLASSVLLWAILNIGGKSKKSVSVVPASADLSQPVTDSVLHLERIVTGEETEESSVDGIEETADSVTQ